MTYLLLTVNISLFKIGSEMSSGHYAIINVTFWKQYGGFTLLRIIINCALIHRQCKNYSQLRNCTDHVNVITGDITIREVFAKGLKYREPKSINWKHNFKILMDSVEDYARQWAKREKEDL